MSATLPLFQVDAFTNEVFRGNPAAVCLLHAQMSDTWMQALGAEMNLSETAFILPRPGGEFSLRWFTPAVEVPLCGHATLASAHVLFEQASANGGGDRRSKAAPLVFHTLSGKLTARPEGDWICLDFPAQPSAPCAPQPGLADALGAQIVSAHRSKMGWLVELASAEVVRALAPDFGRLLSGKLGEIIVTAAGTGSGEGSAGPGDACDFVSRFFAPALGINEDPVTGSAHCVLAPFWAQRLGKNEMVGHQVSQRGGVVRVRVRGDRVELLGQAVTVFRGELTA